ncbi:uncharacterized protein PV07_08672 [Cladophialophora immunda]|uniref:Uncharacterized protein n=1 Tax=Cladophialophora immunda TaxID=569365 RepID=A0A0D1ZCS3_9EURO|nr:uncharacterized protein PV07_08672 [Cladophialophora immunda]KIW25506.1 hypothetical protein PV07_08672 [Cladophialophora immunda]
MANVKTEVSIPFRQGQRNLARLLAAQQQQHHLEKSMHGDGYTTGCLPGLWLQWLAAATNDHCRADQAGHDSQPTYHLGAPNLGLSVKMLTGDAIASKLLVLGTKVSDSRRL